MPHVILEIPSRLAKGGDIAELLLRINNNLASGASVMLADIKTRVHLFDQFCIAGGDKKDIDFVHARLMLLSKNRSEEIVVNIKKTLFTTLEAFFIDRLKVNGLQLSVEVTMVTAEHYLKSSH